MSFGHRYHHRHGPGRYPYLGYPYGGYPYGGYPYGGYPYGGYPYGGLYLNYALANSFVRDFY